MRGFQLLLYILFSLFALLDRKPSYCQKNEGMVLHKIDEQNGLSDNNVQCIYKDKNNFVWIGTALGLNLMDGSDITVFRHETSNPNSLNNNNITAIIGDSKGLLWIGTGDGVNSFDLTTRKFAYYPLVEHGSANSQLVSCLLTDHNDNLYVGTLEGLFFLNRKTGKTETLQVPGKKRELEANNAITDLAIDATGKIWISTYNGLWSYDENKDHFTHEIDAQNDSLFTGLFTYLLIDHSGIIWIGTWDKGLKKYDPIKKRVYTFRVNQNEDISSLTEIKQPNGNYILWVNGNTWAFDPSDNKMIALPVWSGFSKTPLTNNIYTSEDSWVWIGTHQGLYFYNPSKSLFMHHRFSGAITSQVVSLLQWNNKILVSGSGDNFLKAYDNNFRETDDYSKEIRSKDISCLSLKFSGNNTIKAGTSKGIADINLIKHKVIFHHLDYLAKNFISGNFITTLLKDKHNNWWIFPWRYGIWVTDSSYHNFHQVFNNFLVENDRPKPLVIADAKEDKDGNLWFADLDEGIIFYNSTTHTFSKAFTNVLGEKKVTSQILYYHDHFFSFSGTNIYTWNPDRLQIEKIKLPSQNDKPISSIGIDSTGNLWIATQKGLLVYNFKNNVFDRFTTADGLITNEVDATLLCTKNGTMIIGSPDYLSSFVPSRLLSSIDHPPHIQLIEVVANGREIAFDSLHKMSFGHTINNFIFKWTITDYNNPVNNHYYYQLKGIDETWRSAGNHGEVEFANLSPGKYTLLLKAENSNGVNADKILSMSFTILLPFWQTWWFFTLVFLAIAGFFYSLYRYRLKQALQIEKLRNKISLDLHDDIGSTLSSISILSEMALHENQPAETEEMLHEIKENSLSLMERMDDIVWSINPHNDSLENLFLRIKEFASKLFEAKGINYSIHIDENIKHIQLQMEYRQHIYLIMKEAINNLVKYSEANEAKIEAHHHGSHFNILIKDNGKGFDVQKPRSGNGLNSMKTRAKEMKAELKINSVIDQGTSIFVSVKIK